MASERERLWRQAQTLYTRGHLGACASALDRLQEHETGSVRQWHLLQMNRRLVGYALGRPVPGAPDGAMAHPNDELLAYFTEPGRLPPGLLRDFARFKQGEYDDALASESVWLRLMALLATGQQGPALEMAATARTLVEEPWQEYLVAYVYYQAGKYTEALDTLQGMAAPDSKAYNMMGCCLAQLPQGQADTSFKKALLCGEADADVETVFNIAAYYLNTGKLQAARPVMNMALLQLDAPPGQAPQPGATGMDRFKDSVSLGARIPLKQRVLLGLGRIHAGLQDYASAAEYFARVDTDYPHYFNTHPSSEYMHVLLHVGDYAKVLQLGSAESSDPHVQVYRADALLHQGRAQEALELLDRVLIQGGAEDPHRLQAQNLRAMAFIALGNEDTALKVLEMALLGHRTPPKDLVFNFASVLWRRGQRLRAATHWLGALSIALDKAPEYYHKLGAPLQHSTREEDVLTRDTLGAWAAAARAPNK